MKVILLAMGLLFFSACSKKQAEVEPVYTLEEFNAILATIPATPDKNTANAINYSDYSAGANKLNSRPMEYQRLSFTLIEFESVKEARDEAMRLNQYYAKNWLFDKVEGEPILEDLVIVKFHATNPKKRVQRKPKNIPAEAHDSHDSHAAPAGH